LIKNANPNADNFEAPVSGNQIDILQSTSGDVHLYADPLTIGTRSPLLYAGNVLLPFQMYHD
jgi:hypothetical protein